MMTRLDALKIIVEAFPTDPIVVTLGATTRELAATARSDNHLYILDSMGLPPAIGLGMSMALAGAPIGKCVVIEGDGSMLMGLTTFATAGLIRPEKLLLIVLDNGAYAATGGQPTAARAIDLVGIAQSCNFIARKVTEPAELASALAEARTAPGPLYIHVPIGPENQKMPYLLEDPVPLGEHFRQYLERLIAGA